MLFISIVLDDANHIKKDPLVHEVKHLMSSNFGNNTNEHSCKEPNIVNNIVVVVCCSVKNNRLIFPNNIIPSIDKQDNNSTILVSCGRKFLITETMVLISR